MKFLIALITVLIISEECTKASSESHQNGEKVKISYQAISRGFFKQLTFEDTKMTYSEDRDLKTIDTFNISKKEWKQILELTSKLNLEGLEHLIAPTSDRLFDGAAHTTITVNLDDKLYVSSSFDEGHPPAELEALVNKMLTITEKYIQP
jgi:hypothetical protein